MKSKKRKIGKSVRVVKQRKRLEGQIRAQAETSAQLEVAQHGRTLTKIERMLNSYCGITPGKLRDGLRASLGEAILKAIDERDVETLRILTDAVARGPQEALDPSRANLAAMKGVLKDCGLKMTVQEFASSFRSPKSDDGFSQLRRLCKEIGVPIQKGKRGRKNKTNNQVSSP